MCSSLESEMIVLFKRLIEKGEAELVAHRYCGLFGGVVFILVDIEAEYKCLLLPLKAVSV